MFARTLLVVILAWGGSDRTRVSHTLGLPFLPIRPSQPSADESHAGPHAGWDWSYVSGGQELVHLSRPAGSEPRNAFRSAEICPAVTLLAIRHRLPRPHHTLTILWAPFHLPPFISHVAGHPDHLPFW